MTTALIPVKRLADTKSRLLDMFAAHQREAFSLAMLGDVIGALQATSAVDRIVVVTPDPTVATAARAVDAEALVKDDEGLNEALDAAASTLALGPDEPVLVILGVVACALPQDVDAMCEALIALPGGGRRGAVLAPSSDGGTAALLRLPYDVIPSRFGPDSAKRHRGAAAEADVPYQELPLPSLALDLDVSGDIEQFLQTERGGELTRRCLRQLRWGGPAA